jgi:integrase
MTNTIKPKNKLTKLEVINLSEDIDKGMAWNKARELESSKKIYQIEPMDILNIASNIKDIRDRALFSVLYLTACRISEITRYQKRQWGVKKVVLLKEGYKPKRVMKQDYKNLKKIGILQSGLKRKDITEVTIKNIPCVQFVLRNLKHRKKKIKVIPIRLDNNINKQLYHYIYLYIQALEDWRELFPFVNRNGERIINKLGWNPHSLRKVRLTHLYRYEKYNDHDLMDYAGWTDVRPSNAYVKSNPEDLIKV